MGLVQQLCHREEAMRGKTITALKKSKAGRNELVALFGGVENLPTSDMRIRRVEARRDDEIAKSRGYDDTSKHFNKSRDDRLSKLERSAYLCSGKGCQAGALSRFPQNIGRSMVLLYSEPGDTVVDPFAGHNSRMELTIRAGRNYIGCDLSAEFMTFNQKRAEHLRQEYPFLSIDLHHGDSRSLPVKKRTGDFTITSPPYYDIEHYGDEPEQLGKAKTYVEFLGGLGQVMQENYRVLKPGAYAMWFVNDFRRRGKFHTYHVDTMRLGEDAGFVIHDLLVVDLGNSIRDCFTNQIITSRILPKRHEYGIVFRKPERKRVQ